MNTGSSPDGKKRRPAEAAAFLGQVRGILTGPCHVLAVVRASDQPHLREFRELPGVRVLQVTNLFLVLSIAHFSWDFKEKIFSSRQNTALIFVEFSQTVCVSSGDSPRLPGGYG